jgi:hypothetical protein
MRRLVDVNETFDLIALDRHNWPLLFNPASIRTVYEPEAPCPLGSDETSDAAI